MDIRELRYFLQVANSGSFTRAAAELNLAQPALSRQIQKLEYELDQRLFERTPKGAVLTPAGIALAQKAERIVIEVDSLKGEFGDQTPAIQGELTLAVPPAVGQAVLPRLLDAYSERHPKVFIRVLEGVSSSLQEWLLDGRVDVAVLHNPPSLPYLTAEPLLREYMHLIGPAEPKLQGRRLPLDTVRVKDLQGLPLIMPSLPHSNRVLLERAAVQHGIRLNITMEVDSFHLIRSLVRAGRGYAVVTSSAVSRQVRSGDFNAWTIQHPPISTILSSAVRNDTILPPTVAPMLTMLRQTIISLVEAGEWAGDILASP